MSEPRLIQRQHPLWSPTALAAAALFVVALGVVLYATGGQAFSPGELSAVNRTGATPGGVASHAALTDDCRRCHVPFQGLTADNCEACHEHIARQQAVGSGLHGRVAADDCRQCHQEHRGADYQLMAAALAQFTANDHQQLFALQGAHRDLDCLGCHAEERYAGTSSECQACHGEPDVHRGQFGLDCAQCHSAEAWLPASLAFHEFPLDHGVERTLPCAACHNERFVDYSCTGCHEHEATVMRQEHVEKEVDLSETPLRDCVVCHPAGLKEG